MVEWYWQGKEDVVGERFVTVLLDKMNGETRGVNGWGSLVCWFLCCIDIFSNSWLYGYLGSSHLKDGLNPVCCVFLFLQACYWGLNFEYLQKISLFSFFFNRHCSTNLLLIMNVSVLIYFTDITEGIYLSNKTL